MPLLSRIGPFWYFLFPAAVLLALWLRYRPVQQGAALGLLSRRSLVLIRLAFLCCGGYLLAMIAALIFERALLPSVAALVLAYLMAWMLKAAGPGVNPGLLGFQWPLPTDGLDLIAREEQLANGGIHFGWRATFFAPIAPLLAAVVLAAALDLQRPLTWTAMAIAATAPLQLVVQKRTWLRTTSLVFAAMLLLIQAVNLREKLPEGLWITHWNATSCNEVSALSSDGSAWCLNTQTGSIYHYELPWGSVLEEVGASDLRAIFAAGPDSAWVRKLPNTGLNGGGSPVLYVEGDQQAERNLLNPRSGVVGANNDFWLLDSFARLWIIDDVNDRADERQRVQPDPPGTGLNLITGPAGEIWVLSTEAASTYDPTAGRWNSIGLDLELQGGITDLAMGPDDSYWLLQTELPQGGRTWWVSHIRLDGYVQHLDLAALTGIGPPVRAQDAMAVDAKGRLWFLGQSGLDGQVYLGVLTESALTHFSALGPLIPATALGLGQSSFEKYGLVEDGQGGIYLYMSSSEPLRHWRP